jgi:hypothetical protein
MLAYALIIGLSFAGQIQPGDGRYGSGAGTQTPPAVGAAADSKGAGDPSGLLPLSGGVTAENSGDIKIGGLSGSGSATGSAANSGTGAAANQAAPPSGSASPTGSTNPFRASQGAGGTQPRSFSAADSASAVPLNGQSLPAQYQERPNVYASGSAVMKPSSMMRAMLVPPTGTLLSGQPVKLVDLVSSARSRAEQTQRVEAYWDLCSSVTDYYLGLRELGELQRFGQSGGPMWQQVSTEMNTRNATALRAARASQMRLASLMGRGGDLMPLPEDAPHCASYNSHYAEIFPQGGPAEAKELDALLPLRYKELQIAAENVQKSEQLVDSFANGRGNFADGLNSLELLALNRRAFVQIARDYNRRIARYSELASPGEIGAVRLTSMLIKTDTPATATKPSLPAPPRNQRSSTEAAPPKTFAEGTGTSAGPIANTSMRDENVKAASGEESSKSGAKKEHSLLITPK